MNKRQISFMNMLLCHDQEFLPIDFTPVNWIPRPRHCAGIWNRCRSSWPDLRRS